MKKINYREALELDEPTPKATAPAKEAPPEWNQYRTQAEFINRTSTQRSAINKAIADGAPVDDVLLLALECIATMTGDKVFLYENKKKLRR